MMPARNQITICFAHVAYQFQARYVARKTGIKSFQVSSREALEQRIGEADALVISGLWQNNLIEKAPKLRFIQSIGAGTDQFAKDALTKRSIRLASARGVNERAVAEHAIALILALTRRIREAGGNQEKHIWRGMIGDADQREDEIAGKTILVVGLGRIGGRLARIAKGFDLRVLGVRRDPGAGSNGADSIHGMAELIDLLPRADIVALTCPLTPETEGLIGTRALGAMKPSALLINVARGRVVDEKALIEALAAKRIAGAGLDVTVEEPLPSSSPLWDMENVLITPHTAGETRRYEESVLDFLQENLERLLRGETELKNQVV
jgi:phosphoglycerate dehydrogenase-like enzyme